MNYITAQASASSPLGSCNQAAAQNKPSILAVLTELEQSVVGTYACVEDLHNRIYSVTDPSMLKEAPPESAPPKSDMVMHRLQDLTGSMYRLQAKLRALNNSVAL